MSDHADTIQEALASLYERSAENDTLTYHSARAALAALLSELDATKAERDAAWAFLHSTLSEDEKWREQARWVLLASPDQCRSIVAALAAGAAEAKETE